MYHAEKHSLNETTLCALVYPLEFTLTVRSPFATPPPIAMGPDAVNSLQLPAKAWGGGSCGGEGGGKGAGGKGDGGGGGEGSGDGGGKGGNCGGGSSGSDGGEGGGEGQVRS